MLSVQGGCAATRVQHGRQGVGRPDPADAAQPLEEGVAQHRPDIGSPPRPAAEKSDLSDASAGTSVPAGSTEQALALMYDERLA